MPPKSKNKAKVFSHTTTKKTPSSDSQEPPIPFKRASAVIQPFLSKLPKKHVYITHLDTHPARFKMQIFLVPVLMNIVIVALLIYRVKTIGPYYFQITQSLSGHPNETTIDHQVTPTSDLISEILRRTGTFALDLCLYIFIWPWPRSFFFGMPSNPTGWRLNVWFRDTEIIVRKSRTWDLGIGDVVQEGAEGEDGGRIFLQNVRKAVAPVWLVKTGYLMLNKEWDLDWRAMIKAHRFVKNGTIPQDEFQTGIFVHSPEFGWVSFEAFPKNAASANGDLSASEEEGRKKIMAFKDELTAIGKENLFFRWIELIQFEASQPGGFGPERQVAAVEKAKEMFEAQGVDFEKFWAKIGGMSHMPGFDER